MSKQAVLGAASASYKKPLENTNLISSLLLSLMKPKRGYFPDELRSTNKILTLSELPHTPLSSVSSLENREKYGAFRTRAKIQIKRNNICKVPSGKPDILQHLINNNVCLLSVFTSQIPAEPSELNFPWLSQGGQIAPSPAACVAPCWPLDSAFCFDIGSSIGIVDF